MPKEIPCFSLGIVWVRSDSDVSIIDADELLVGVNHGKHLGVEPGVSMILVIKHFELVGCLVNGQFEILQLKLVEETDRRGLVVQIRDLVYFVRVEWSWDVAD